MVSNPPSECEHHWQFQGIVWSHAEYPTPGTGARDMVYEDRYFCDKCLEIKDKNKRIIGNSYEQPIEGSFPK